MAKNIRFNSMFSCRKGEEEIPTTRHIAYWILIFACIVIMWFIVNGIINKILVLY